MINLKSNNSNQISPFVSSLFAKAIAKCNVPLEWIKNNPAKFVGLQDVLKMSSGHVLKTSPTHLQCNNFSSSKTF